MTTPRTVLIESVCVYCGSRRGDDPDFVAAARRLGAGVAERGLRLVYGAGDVGLMGEVAGAAMLAGGATIGVMPKHLLDLEVGRRDLTALVVTETMHERKKVMFANADAIIALPGGAGTLDELVEVLTWRQLGLHDKPLILVSVNGYWEPLVALIEHMIDRGFASERVRDFLTVVGDADAALALLPEPARRT